MRRFKISHAFAKMTDADLEAFCMIVIRSLTGNANFPVTTPPLADVKVLSDDFMVALANAADGGKTLKGIKNKKRKLLIQGMYKLAGCIEYYNNIDEAKLLSSGFKLYGGNVRGGIFRKDQPDYAFQMVHLAERYRQDAMLPLMLCFMNSDIPPTRLAPMQFGCICPLAQNELLL